MTFRKPGAVEIVRIEAVMVAAQDLHFDIDRRIRDEHLEHETVELRFGQRIGAFVLDRVLRGDHHERQVEHMAFAFEVDLFLLHRFEQRRLGFGRGAVDLIGQEELREDRSLLQMKTGRVHVEHARAENVGWHQVGRELDTRELWPAPCATSVFAINVLAVPGTPSSRTCPPLKRATTSSSKGSSSADQHFAGFGAQFFKNRFEVSDVHNIFS